MPFIAPLSSRQSMQTVSAISSGVTHFEKFSFGIEDLFSSVAMIPGAIELTVIPVPFTSLATLSVNKETPAFAMA